MATDVGSIYLEVFADTKALKAQVRKAAKDAGKAFGKEWGDEAEKSMSPALSSLGKQMLSKMENNGRLSGRALGDAFKDELRSIERDLDFDIVRAFGGKGSWADVFDQFGSLDEAVDKLTTRIDEANGSTGQLTRAMGLGAGGAQKLKDQMNAAADAIREQGKANKESAEENERAVEAERQRTEQNKRLADTLKASQKAQEDQNKALKDALTLKSAQDTARLRNEHDNLQRALSKSTQEMKAFGNVDSGNKQAATIRSLNSEYDTLNTQLRKTLQQHNVTTAGMDKNSQGYIDAVARQRQALAGFDKDLRALDKRKMTLKIDVDTPSAAEVKTRGALLGKIFGKAFSKGSGSGSGAVGSAIDGLSSKWKEFSTAFPAEITILIRYFMFLIGPISTVGSAIGSVLIPLIGALGVAAIGAASALAGIGVAGAYAFALAKKSFDVFKTSFPETQAALDSLKDSFENVDVPRFASEWSDSLKRFSQTLADSLRFDQVAEMLGKATAAITDSFSNVLNSPAWTGFVDSIDGVAEGVAGPLANALQGLGTGLAGVFGVALQWMTAAAPLAEHLAGLFSTWATNLNAALATQAGQEQLTGFMNVATAALDQIIPLVSNLAAAFGNVFRQGADEGTTMLTVLAGLAANFNTWTQSAAGQESLNQLFSQGLTVFNALVPLIGAIGQAFATMVTPATVQSLILFMNALTQILPIFAQLVLALSNLGAFDLLASLLQVIFSAVQPLIPVIGSLASIIGANLSIVISALGPLLTALASALGPVLQTFGELAGALGPAIVQVIGALSPVFGALGPVISAVLQALMPLIPIFVTLITIIANLVTAILPPLMPVFAAIGQLFTALGPIIGELGAMIADLLVKAVTALAPLLVALVPVLLSLIEAFMPIISTVMEVAGVLIDALMPVFMALIPIITTLAPTIVQLVIAFTPVLRIIQLLAPVITALLPPISSLIVFLLDLITPLIELIEPIITFAVQLFAGKKAIDDIMKGLQAFGMQVIKIAGSIGGFFGKIGQAFTNVGSTISGFFGNVLSNIGSFITRIVAFGENIVLGLLQGLTGAWSAVTLWFTNVIEGAINLVKGLFGISSPSTVFLDFGTNIIQGLLDGLIAMASAVGTFFTDMFMKVLKIAVDFITAYITFWVELPGKVIAAVSALVEMVGTWIGDVWAKIVEIGTAAWDAYVTFWTEVPQKIIDAVTGLIDLAGTWISDVWAKIVEIGTTAWNNEVAFWTSLPDRIIGFVSPLIARAWQWMQDVWKSFDRAIDTGWAAVLSFFTSLPGKIMAAIANLVSLITTFGTDVINGFKSGLESAWGAVSSWVGGIGDKIKGLVGSGLDLLRDVGSNIVQGLANGISGAWSKVTSKVNELVNKIPAAVRDLLGINSPSKVFMEIGAQTMAGMRVGMAQSGKPVVDQARRIAESMTNVFNVGSTASLGVNPSRGGGNRSNPIGRSLAGATVASGAIQIVTPTRDPAIVASMVLDGLVARAQ